jgi:hypothetical protein
VSTLLVVRASRRRWNEALQRMSCTKGIGERMRAIEKMLESSLT